jgi:acyl-coenzyme A synthetase/AMP-(fatty) acid ligase
MGIRGGDRNLAVIPFGHSYGLGNLIMPLILQGTSLAIAGAPFPHAVSSAAKASGATVFPAVPPLLNGLVRAEVPIEDLNSVRLFISAGSPISPSDAQAFRERFGKRVHNFYGASETGGIAFDRTGEDTLTGEAAGTPLDGVTLHQSASGRLLVSSKAVFTRYNRRRLGRNGACLLPDLIERRPDGAVILKGRTARQIKLGGKRLALAEVEEAFKRIAGVHEVFVTGFQDQRGDTRLGAVLLHETPLETIKEAIRERLPAWKRPSRWQSVGEWPVTARGKPDFKRLKQLLESRPADRAEP